jgi:putative copper export protein/methionine-rich copper-binding protein CopC
MRHLCSAGALVVGLLAPATAHGHDALLRSSPAKDAHLATAPTALRLTFNRAPKLALVRVVLTGPSDRVIELSRLRLDSTATVVADIVGPIVAGVYRVTWQVTGTDGHPVRGEFRFTVAPASPTESDPHAQHLPDTGAATSHHDPVSMPAGEFGVQSPAYVGVRWVVLSALLVLFGAVAFHFVVLRAANEVGGEAWIEHADSRLARAATISTAVLICATAARLVVQSLAVHGQDEVFDLSLIRGLLLQTRWGYAWLAAFAAAIATLAALSLPARARWKVAAGLCVVLAGAQAISGHAVIAGPAAIAADGVHLMAAGGWIGGLTALMFVGIPAAMTIAEPQRLVVIARLVNRFSPMALISAGMLVMTGAINGFVHLRSLPALWQSEYGQTLLWKLGVLSIVAATGAYNWKRVRPSLHESAGVSRLRRSASIELAVAAVVIVVTAVLVATPPPVMAPAVASPPTP